MTTAQILRFLHSKKVSVQRVSVNSALRAARAEVSPENLQLIKKLWQSLPKEPGPLNQVRKMLRLEDFPRLTQPEMRKALWNLGVFVSASSMAQMISVAWLTIPKKTSDLIEAGWQKHAVIRHPLNRLVSLLLQPEIKALNLTEPQLNRALEDAGVDISYDRVRKARLALAENLTQEMWQWFQDNWPQIPARDTKWQRVLTLLKQKGNLAITAPQLWTLMLIAEENISPSVVSSALATHNAKISDELRDWMDISLANAPARDNKSSLMWLGLLLLQSSAHPVTAAELQKVLEEKGEYLHYGAVVHALSAARSEITDEELAQFRCVWDKVRLLPHSAKNVRLISVLRHPGCPRINSPSAFMRYMWHVGHDEGVSTLSRAIRDARVLYPPRQPAPAEDNTELLDMVLDMEDSPPASTSQTLPAFETIRRAASQ
ncbi:hypothetical protein [Pantoea cypripedii]|uniref:hypothetical protein n=1 Tax=Pantoea cypripedii TaxID=55209 RepID=UPI001ABF573B|nr:hypothetical protein [Pantoea cypripedii]